MDSKPTIRLIPAEGEVLAPRDFADRFDYLLAEAEQAFVKSTRGSLGGKAEIPEWLRSPLIAAEPERDNQAIGILTWASGARSALREKQCIQFKGCRLAKGGTDFPFESIPWGEDRIIRTRIPFGVMTAEAVQRELLGHCFCLAHAIPCATTPVCVYAYSGGRPSGRCCLVLRVPDGRRAESFLRMSALSVSELIDSAPSDDARLTGSEARLHGLNSRWYADQKAR